MEGRSADHRRSIQARQHRPDGEDHHAGAQREMVGRAGQARQDRLPRHRPRRADRRAGQRRDRRMDIGPDVNKYNARQGHRGNRHPHRRRPELPAPHDQRHRRRSCRTSRCGRRWPWRSIGRRSRGRCSARSASRPQPLDNHIFMANQAGYQDNSGEVGKYDPRRRRNCSTKPAGSWTATCARRTASRSRSSA